MPDLTEFTAPGRLASTIAAAAFTSMVGGAALTLTRGGWLGRLLLVAGALVWPFPDHPVQGPVLVKLSYLHGVHAADLLSLVAVGIAVFGRPRQS